MPGVFDDQIRSRYDPMYRAVNWRYLPKAAREGQNTLQQLQDLRFNIAALGGSAGDDLGLPSVETLNALPAQVTLGRLIAVRLPDETITSIYIGVQLPDGSLIWQLMAKGVDVSGPGAGSGNYTFVGHAGTWGTVGPRYLARYANDIVATTVAGNSARKYNTTTGSITILASSYPNPNTPAADGITCRQVSEGGTFGFVDTYVSVPDSYVTQLTHLSNGNANIINSSPARNYRGVVYDAIDDVVVAVVGSAGDIVRLATPNLGTLTTPVTTGLTNPRGISYDPNNSGIFAVADSGGNRVRIYSHTFVAGIIIGGTLGSADGQFNNPTDVAFDSAGRLYVVDSGNHRVQVFNMPAGSFFDKFGSSGSGDGQFSSPIGIEIIGNDIYVADTGNLRMSKWLRSTV